MSHGNASMYQELAAAVGAEHVLTDADMVAGYVRDWTGRWTGHTAGVVRPGSVEEVQQVVRICSEHRVPLVPQGGNTGLVGGSIPHNGEVVVSLRRLDWIGPVDQKAGEIAVGSGVTIGALQDHARSVGLVYGVDLASRDSATVGGTIATNAGGSNVVAHGDTRRQVLGLEVVFADGTAGSRSGVLVKESTGPDPLRLMVGSEGSLGVITSARLRLIQRPPVAPTVTLVALERLQDGLRYLQTGVTALEFFSRACLEMVVAHRSLSRPMPSDAPFYVLIESVDLPDVEDPEQAVVDERLWVYRESITETISQIGVPTKLDVALPLDRLDDFAVEMADLGLRADVYLYGHLAEGNFHVNVLGAEDPTEVVDRVLTMVLDMDGAIASEHGIGVSKASWWRRSMDPALLAVNRRVKDALDPGGILNPEVFWGG